jgi:hypothetical protein
MAGKSTSAVKHRRHRRAVRVRMNLAVCVCLTSLSGCRASQAGRTARQETPQSYDREAEEELVRSDARAYAHDIARCLRAQGLPAFSPGVTFELPINQMIDNDVEKLRIGYGVVDTYNAQQRAQVLAASVNAALLDPTPPYVSSSQAYYTEYQRCFTALATDYPRLKRILDSPGSEVDFNTLHPAVESDPQMATLRKRWRKCMTKLGVRDENPWAIRDRFVSALAEVAPPIPDGGATPNAQPGGQPGSQPGAGPREVTRRTRKQAKAIERVRLDELRIARLDATCSEPIAVVRDQIWKNYLQGESRVDNGK